MASGVGTQVIRLAGSTFTILLAGTVLSFSLILLISNHLGYADSFFQPSCPIEEKPLFFLISNEMTVSLETVSRETGIWYPPRIWENISSKPSGQKKKQGNNCHLITVFKNEVMYSLNFSFLFLFVLNVTLSVYC